MKKEQYVQYGCGWCAPETWINFDASPTLYLERLPLIGAFISKNKKPFPKNAIYGDIVRGLPVQNASCDAVYCSHVLEHLALNDLRKALRNTYKIMKEGGVFRFVIPDLEYYINRYNQNQSAEAAIFFLRETLLGKEARKQGLKGFVIDWLGNSKHLWMWDYKSITSELEKVGFVSIRRAVLGDSSLPVFNAVEESKRWLNALGIECKKI